MATVWCMSCAADGKNVPATVEVDGDPMCAPCADYMQRTIVREGGQPLPQRALTLAPTPVAPSLETPPSKPLAPELCPCGSGRPKGHRGACRGDRSKAQREATDNFSAESEPQMSPEIDIPIARKVMEKMLAKAPQANLRIARPLLSLPPKRRGLMDTLVSAVVRDEEIPEEAAPPPKKLGRLGEIWEALDELEEGCSLAVQNRDRQHLAFTSRNLRKGAPARGKRLRIRVNGTTLFVRYLREGEPLHGAEQKQ